LGVDQAVAVGSETAAEAVYRGWARARQARGVRRPLHPRAYYVITYGALLFVLTVVLALYVSAIVTGNPQPSTRSVWIVRAIGIAGLTCGILALVNLLRTPRYSSSFAQIEPVSLHEYRANRSMNVYPRKNLIVTIASVLVAIASVIVAIIALQLI